VITTGDPGDPVEVDRLVNGTGLIGVPDGECAEASGGRLDLLPGKPRGLHI
jgi:hypothetical protein